MLNGLIDFSLRHRVLVILLALASAAVGVVSIGHLDIDAFPDTTPVMVQINTVAPALGPEEVERQITFPLEQALSGMRGLEALRSVSKFGLSQLTVVFQDGTDIYFARQLINERLTTVELPAGIARPKMGPVSTGLGEVFHYVVKPAEDISGLSPERQQQRLTEVRTVHDWVIKPAMRTVSGTAEINSWGGFEKQYQVRIDPQRLIKYDLTFEQVVTAVAKNNRNIGGGNITIGSQMQLVHGIGRTVNVEQIRNIVVTARDGVPTRIRDVADVEIGHEIRRGAVTANGRGEVVLGLGFMLMGENSHVVTRKMKAKLDEIRQTLPAGIEIVPVYDRTELIDHVIDTVRRNLFEGGLLVVTVLFLFLGNLRAAAIVALAIPLSMLCAFSGMLQVGIAASLLSLGALDFGMIVDSSVVMVENCVRRLGEEGRGARDEGREADLQIDSVPAVPPRSPLAPHPSPLKIIRDAAVEVRQPTLFGELIIMIVYLPILTLEGIEGKLFRPMALTVIFALLGSMVLSMTLMPVLASLILPRRIREETPLFMRIAHALHNPILRLCMSHKVAVLGIAATVLLVAFGMIAPQLGAEFIPRLSEGAIAVSVVRLAGTDLSESVRGNTQIEKALLAAFPDEIRHTWSRIGSAEIATDPMGVELTDLFVSLMPRSAWTKAKTQGELVELMERELRQISGLKLAFAQPIEMRMNELISGSRLDVAVKLFGDDLDLLARKAGEIGATLEKIPGAADINVEQITGQPILQIRIDQEAIARYGVAAGDVLDIVEALGSKPVGEVTEGQLRFPLIIRLPEAIRQTPQTIGAILVPTPSGERLPLSSLTRIETVEGPSTITREWGQRRVAISCNVRGRDMVGFVEEARRAVADKVPLPPGRYRVEWGGQFEHYDSARHRLLIVVPLAVALIFTLLYLTYHNVVDSARVLTGVPLGWVGGIFGLWLRDMPFSISAAIGFIAMSGVAVLDDMILVSYIRQLRSQGKRRDEAVREAAVTRLRPVLMTTLVASLGFLPMAMSTGMGAEVQRPLATVVIGGVISAMVMSLLVIRVLYVVFDNASHFGRWLLEKLFGWTDEQLVWLFGENWDALARHPVTEPEHLADEPEDGLPDRTARPRITVPAE